MRRLRKIPPAALSWPPLGLTLSIVELRTRPRIAMWLGDSRADRGRRERPSKFRSPRHRQHVSTRAIGTRSRFADRPRENACAQHPNWAKIFGPPTPTTVPSDSFLKCSRSRQRRSGLRSHFLVLLHSAWDEGDAVVRQVVANQTSNDLRRRDILAGAKCLEGLFFEGSISTVRRAVLSSMSYPYVSFMIITVSSSAIELQARPRRF